MEIVLQKAGRSFGAQQVFQNLDLAIAPGDRLAVLGGNGSGKSTLLKCLYGALSLSAGSIRFQRAPNEEVPALEAGRSSSYAAPYLELIEELPALEFLQIYRRFRNLNLRPEALLEAAYLEQSALKQIMNLSSGMRQRLRLALALHSSSEVVLLDEPTSNLDPAGVAWFQEQLQQNLGDRTLVVGSNFQQEEIFYCSREIALRDYQ